MARDVATCNLLNAFLDQVNQKETDGQLTSQQAAGLRQQATAIQETLGCSSSSSSSSFTSIRGMVGSMVHSTIPNINNLERLLGNSLERMPHLSSSHGLRSSPEDTEHY